MNQVTVIVATDQQTHSFRCESAELSIADLLAQCLTRVAEAFDDRHLATVAVAEAAAETTVLS